MKFDIVRAWKDESYRSSLSSQEQAMLPENPAGALDLSDAELETIQGATNINGNVSGGCTSDQQWSVVGNTIRQWGNDPSNIEAQGNSCVSN
jgi:mersacidin/lichenicidin family type 2 lantibiotic